MILVMQFGALTNLRPLPRTKVSRAFLLFCLWLGLFPFASQSFAEVRDPTQAFDDDHVANCIDKDDLAGWAFKPGCKDTASRAGHKFDFRINREGIRGPDYPAKAPKGTTRIFVVGASIFFGPGIKETEAAAAVLEKNFRQAGEKVEVLNVSTEGYSSVQLFLRLKQWVAAYHPDIVLFNLTSQDIFVDQMLASMNLVTTASYPLPERIHHDPAHILPESVLTKLYRWPAIHRMVSAVIYSYHRLMISWRYALSPKNQEREKVWAENSVEALRRLQKMSEQQHFKFYTFLYSDPELTNTVRVNPNLNFGVTRLFDIFTPNVAFPATSIYRILEENRLPYFVTLMPEGPEFYLPRDYHFTAAGAKFMGDQLFAKRDLYFPAKKKKGSRRPIGAPHQR